MKLLVAVLHEAFGLFVDDGAFALAILAWLAIVGLVAGEVHNAKPFCGLLLFLGLVFILAAGVVRRARR